MGKDLEINDGLPEEVDYSLIRSKELQKTAVNMITSMKNVFPAGEYVLLVKSVTATVTRR